ncbi:hypothetical protein Ddye_016548 [Dipteronia dyeriana]|uniref:DUF8040 domain-containing protein n=1 Tax=Dipteronia dyeriana TaxID=168575 RepID=A0AAD9U7E9_9ROSI|nr:hypothetical protein Ddye_016548 [Dipteronia dyeriana]
MDRNAIAMLCELLKTRGGLLDDGNVTIDEQIATFINILAHHTKNRSIQVRFYRSDETISRYVHRVLKVLLHLEDVLFIKPTPVLDDCTNSMWRWFKGCLGAIDGTYIEVTVPESDKPRYRTRKGHIATNVLGKIDMSDRLHWTLEEEDAMISILEGIVADGGRCDTGSFRPVGSVWMTLAKCVTMDDLEILTEYLKKHPNKNYTVNRPFPHYERLVTVFGKDRATGSMAESAADALDHMGLENEESDTAGFTEPSSTPSNVSFASSYPNSGQTSNRKRKRNGSSTVADITKVFEKSMERASADIAKLTEAITGGDAMTRLGVELEGMGLNRMQVIRVAMYFGNKSNQLRIWNGLDDSYKLDFVNAILDE